jgi:hypothetical protein
MYDFTLAVLSWNAHRTLKNTLESYKVWGLDVLANERIIYFQEFSQEDRDIARKYGYKAIGSPDNVGIAKAYDTLVNTSTKPFFLFLENDWILLENPHDIINDSIAMLDNRYVHVVRMRHRQNPGAPLWTLQFKDEEYERPTHLLDAVHWTEADKFPEIFVHHGPLGVKFYCAFAPNANWTNNPTMFRTEWLKRHIVPRMGNRDVELDLQAWWEHQTFVVGYASPGLFSHRRIG